MSNDSTHNKPSGNSALPVLALVFAFLIPIAGIVMGRIALGRMYRGQIDDSNRSLAKAAVVLGWIFTILTVVLLLFFAPYVYFFLVFLISGGYPLKM